jgi:hypothetical protein
MQKIFRQTFFFVVGYSILMSPTYVLPWLGSNSAVLNVAGAIVGHGMTPQWWVHSWSLVMLILMAWVRGEFICKKYLPAFPFLAAVFDMTPGLSMIPLIPSALHLTTIIIGLKVGDPRANTDLLVTSRRASLIAGLMTVTTISGSLLFVFSSKDSFSESAKYKSAIPEKLNQTLPSIAPISPEQVSKSLLDKENTDRQHSSNIKKHSANHKVKNKSLQKKTAISNQSPTHDDVGEIRYININE